MTVDIMTNVLQQGAKHGDVEITQGLPANCELVDVDWDEVLGVISYIFDVGDGDDNIYDEQIMVKTNRVVQTPLF